MRKTHLRENGLNTEVDLLSGLLFADDEALCIEDLAKLKNLLIINPQIASRHYLP